MLITELPDQENSDKQSLPLDYLITEIEIHSAVQKLKNNKSSVFRQNPKRNDYNQLKRNDARLS